MGTAKKGLFPAKGWTCGYRDGSPEGRAFQMPDWTYGFVADADAAEVAADLRRSTGTEPPTLAVRGRMIRLAKARKKVRDGGHGRP